MEYGIRPDPSGRTFPLLVQCDVVYTTLGWGLVEITPNWAWPTEVRGDLYLLYKEVFTSLLGQDMEPSHFGYWKQGILSPTGHLYSSTFFSFPLQI
ncbi:hypothetical protein Hanom_Chr03g00178921 [Helianthus anomalus]